MSKKRPATKPRELIILERVIIVLLTIIVGTIAAWYGYLLKYHPIEATFKFQSVFLYNIIFRSNIAVQYFDTHVYSACNDISSDCHQLSFGACFSAPGYAVLNCPHTCNMCDLLDPVTRCAHLYNNRTAFKSLEINFMFESMINKLHHTHNLTIYSKDPYIIELQDFMTSSDTQSIIKLVHDKFEVSASIGGHDDIGRVEKRVDESRTSRTAWCQTGCDDHDIIAKYTSMIEDIIKVPRINYEHIQFLRYARSEHYDVHHDVYPSSYPLDAAGPRVLTMLLYLSDVQGGGETYFSHPKLNIKVKPRMGSVLIWSNMLSSSPEIKDPRMIHEAKAVLSNDIKYAANLWVHMNDYRTPNIWGCT